MVGHDRNSEERDREVSSGPSSKKETAEAAALLLAHFYFDADLGRLRWKKSTSIRMRVGDIAGHRRTNGYRAICILGRLYTEHRVVWLINYGDWPSLELDHINGIRDDNRLSNLRLATRFQNMQNQPAHRGGRALHVGVKHNRGRYIVTIQKDNKRHYLGCYATPDEAAQAYIAAKLKFHEFCPVVRAECNQEQSGE